MKRIDCSTITIRNKIEKRKDFPDILKGNETGGCYYKYGFIHIKVKRELSNGLEDIVANLISHETLHKIIHLFVGWRESDLPDDFLNLICKNNVHDVKIDYSGLILK